MRANTILLFVAGIGVVAGCFLLRTGAHEATTVLVGLAVATAGYLTGLLALGRWHGRLSPAALAILVAVTLLARLPLVLAPPVLEDDVYRYLWDGAVLATGESPYRFSPQEVYDRRLERPLPEGLTTEEERRLDGLARLSRQEPIEAAFLRINYPSVPTIYPPLSQVSFAALAAVAPGSLVAMKTALVLFDLATAVFVAGLLGALGISRRWTATYAWSPLVLVSFAGAAHVDAIPVALLSGALLLVLRGRPTGAGVFLGAGIAAKLFPAITLPALRRVLGWKGASAAVAIVVLTVLPFVTEPRFTEGLSTYATVWTFNAAGFAVVASIVDALGGAPHTARVISGIIVLGITLFAALGADRDPTRVLRASAIALTALVLMAPAVNPWYVAWLVPFAAVLRSPSLVALTVTILGYYAYFLEGGAPAGLRVFEFGVPAVVAVLATRWPPPPRGRQNTVARVGARRRSPRPT